MANEKRLIDASAWKSFYEDKKNILDRFYTHDAGYEDALDNVDDWMDAQPTVDAVEVAHGRWECEFETYGKLRCSVCKEEALLEKDIGNVITLLYVTSNYCPYCGAKMDGDGDG